MILYHGSNVEVRAPRLIRSDRRLDFGSGFYLTSSKDQAVKWANLTTKRRAQGKPVLSIFDFAEDSIEHLNILKFNCASVEWLHFVGCNRKGEPEQAGIDLVIEPVANDNTMPVLRLFFSDVYTEEETIRRLLPQNLTDQYAFKTQNALDALTFCEVNEV